MTKQELIDLIEGLDPLDLENCTEAAEALVEMGIVVDDGDNFDPDLAKLSEYPESVRDFVRGMCFWNAADEEKLN
jgi:hypothetical protein